MISGFRQHGGRRDSVGIGETLDKTKRFWRGFNTMEDANGLFQVIERMTPLANHYGATFLRCEGQPGYVLHLVIPKTRDIVHASSGEVYVRRNAQNLRVSGDEAMQRLRLEQGNQLV